MKLIKIIPLLIVLAMLAMIGCSQISAPPEVSYKDLDMSQHYEVLNGKVLEMNGQNMDYDAWIAIDYEMIDGVPVMTDVFPMRPDGMDSENLDPFAKADDDTSDTGDPPGDDDPDDPDGGGGGKNGADDTTIYLSWGDFLAMWR